MFRMHAITIYITLFVVMGCIVFIGYIRTAYQCRVCKFCNELERKGSIPYDMDLVHATMLAEKKWR